MSSSPASLYPEPSSKGEILHATSSPGVLRTRNASSVRNSHPHSPNPTSSSFGDSQTGCALSRPGTADANAAMYEIPKHPICGMHRNLLNSLWTSKQLDSIHVEVHNESYWYHQRRLLGAKKHKALIITQNSNSNQWEGSIYRLKPREEDMAIVPQKSFVSAHKSKWSAYRHAEQAAQDRDSNPIEKLPIDSIINDTDIKATHFRLVIVSANFDRKSMLERVALVYEALLNDLGVQLNPKSNSLGLSAPTRIKMGTTFGVNMCNLDVFRVLLPSQPLSLIIQTKTPSQWNPNQYPLPTTERLGKTHMSIRQIANVAKPAAQKSRIKKLTTKIAANSDLFSSSTHSKSAIKKSHADTSLMPVYNISQSKTMIIPSTIPSIASNLGLENQLSDIIFKKKGGIYGHFFLDLSHVVKDMVMDRVKFNKTMIQTESVKQKNSGDGAKKKKVVDSFVPKTTMSMLRAKLENAAIMAEYDKGTNTEEEMVEEVLVAAKMIEHATIRLQRIWRMSFFCPCKAQQVDWKRKYGTITIQRLIRGVYGRRYFKLLRKIKPIAVVRIQKMFRNYKHRQIIKVWKFLSYRLTRVVLPKIKRFLRNCFLSWSARHDSSAITIQALVRMWLCRNRFIRHMCERVSLLILEPAVIKIQRLARGIIGRKKIGALEEVMLFVKVSIPQACKIQRVWRGTRGVLIIKQKRLELKACLLIQKQARTYVNKIWTVEMQRQQLLYDSAVTIQRIYRGRLDKEVYSIRKEHHWYYNIFLPAVVKVQSISRCMTAMKKVQLMMLRLRASFKLQRSWRLYKKRLASWERWKKTQLMRINGIVAKLQKIVRGHLCRLRYPMMKLIHHGQVVLAAKIIWRAWKNFVYAKRLQILLDDNRVKTLTIKLQKVLSSKVSIEEDLEEIKGDIEIAMKAFEANKVRLRELDKFIVEVEMRLPNIEKAIAALTVDDFELGWADAYTKEFETLSQQHTMAKEETRLLKNVSMKRQHEISKLYWEVEETEYELYQVVCIEVEIYESLRRAEVMRIERCVRDNKIRAIRVEKCKWKVESVRSNVIRRNRLKFNKAWTAFVQHDRDIKFATTLSYESRQQQKDKEEQLLKILMNASATVGFDIQPYEEYARPLQTVYDAAVDNTRSLLRGYTLDERARRLTRAQQDEQKKKRFNKGGQFASLKEDFR